MPVSRTARRRPRLLPLLALGALLGAPAWAKSIDELDAKLRKEAVEKAAQYFDESVDRWLGRKEFKAVLDKLVAGGDDPLKDLDLLQGILYQGRAFDQEFSEKAWQKANDIKVFAQSGPYSSLNSERLRFTYALSSSYPNRQQLKKTRPAPLPLLFVLHDEQDYTGDDKSHPGELALKRLWPAKEFPGLYESWMMLAPAAPRAKFAEDDGTLRRDFTTEVFAQFWKRYHVDFDRVVLDGGDAALAMAAAQPVFFAGVVLRGGKPDPATVKNFAALPVYVVGDEGLKKALEAAGHPGVTLGNAAGLPEWLAARRRALPPSFQWTIARPDQLLAYWVNVDNFDPAAPERGLVVSVDREKNRIEIQARGVNQLSCFLNDRIVDLDREVEVVVNGHVERKEKLVRNFDQMLDRDPIRIRRSMYLGWLFPASFQGIVVRAPESKPAEGAAAGTEGTPPPPAPPETPPDPMAEERAGSLWSKAEEAETSGDLARAKELYQKIVGLGATSHKAKAEAKVQEIAAKLEGPK